MKKKMAPTATAKVTKPMDASTGRKEAAAATTSGKRLKALSVASVELARVVAGNPSAPPELLIELSRHADETVRRRVAGNPSAPAKAAMAVGSQFPEELLGNAAFDLYLLQEPGLLEGIGASALRALLKREVCPESFFAYAARQEDEATQLAVLASPRVPRQVVESLAASAHARVREAAAQHVVLAAPAPAGGPGWRKEFATALVEEAQRSTKIPVPHRSLAYLLLDGVRDLRALDEAEGWVVRTALLAQECWEFGDVVLDIAQAVAQNPSTSERFREMLLESLSMDGNPNVRCMVAENPAVPDAVRVSLLEALAKDSDPAILSRVATNPSTPEALRERLLKVVTKDTGSWARLQVDENPHIPDEPRRHLSADLVKDKDWAVRRTVARNLSGPAELFGVLAKDDHRLVRCAVAANTSTPIELLTALSVDDDEEVRRHVGENRMTPHVVLSSLAKDAEYHVRRSVAQNPSTPAVALEALAGEYLTRSRWLRAGEPSNELTSEEFKELLEPVRDDGLIKRLAAAKRVKDLTGLRREFLGRMVAGNRPSVSRTVALLLPDCPIEVLAKTQRSSWWLERCAIAESRRIPDTLRKRLVKDAHSVVSAAATACAGVSPRAASGTVAPERTNEPLPADWRAKLNEALERMDSALTGPPDRAVVRAHQSLAYLLWREWRHGKKLDDAELALVRGAIPEFANWAMLTELVEKNPETAVRLLEALANDKYEIVLRRFAEDPTTPVRMLEGLASHGNLYVRMSAAMNPSMPTRVLESLAKDSMVCESVAKNPSTPPTALEKLARNKEEDVRENVARNPASPGSVLQLLARDKHLPVRYAIAENPGTPVALRKDVLEKLAKEGGPVMRSEVAAHPSTPNAIRESLLANLLSEVDRRARDREAKHPRGGRDHLERIALAFVAVDESTVRANVAANPLTPPVVLERLSKEREPDIRVCVAKNPGAPTTLLALLTKDRERAVRTAVSTNPTTPLALQRELAKDSSKFVRLAIAGNPALPGTLRELLANDTDPDVRSAIARDGSMSIGILSALAKDREGRVRAAAAANTSLTADLFATLAADVNEEVRCATAANPCVPSALVASMVDDPSDMVWRAASANPALPAKVRATLAPEPWLENRSSVIEALKTPTTAATLRAKLVKDLLAGLKPSYSRTFGLLLPDCPATALTKCATSSLWMERCAVALHAVAPAKVVATLACDSNMAVSAAATWRMANPGQTLNPE